MATKLQKNYFAAKVEQLYSSDPRQWWTKTKRILNFSHMPKADRSILEDLQDDYSSDFIIDPEEVANYLAISIKLPDLTAFPTGSCGTLLRTCANRWLQFSTLLSVRGSSHLSGSPPT